MFAGRLLQHLTPLLLALAVLGAGCAEQLGARDEGLDATVLESQSIARSVSHPLLWYDAPTFFQAVRDAQFEELEDNVAGAIIPHHWLAGHLITGLFASLTTTQQPDTIVLVGPNHNNAGPASSLTSNRPWSTPFGLVEPNVSVIDSLLALGVVKLGGDILTPEHSVAGIMPAIAYYLPNAQVVPIILASEVGQLEAVRIADALASLLGEHTVIVASVDFSHYLVSEAARERDAETAEALRSFDIEALFRMGNDHLDSPPSIAVLLETMRAIGSNEFVLIENTNSGVLANDELSPTTSYFSGYYQRPNRQ